DRGHDVAAQRRVGDERRGVVARLGPAVDDLGRPVAPGHRERQAAVVDDPLELLDGQEDRGQGRRVVGLVLAAVLERDPEVEERRAPAAVPLDPLDALDGGGGEGGDPQAAVRGQRLLRREVVGVDLRGVEPQAAGRRGAVDEHEPLGTLGAAGRDRHARRGLVVGEAVGVDVRGRLGLRRRARRRLDDLGVLEVGRRLRAGRELRGELAEAEVLAAPPDEAERGGVPERGGAAVAEHDLVAAGEREQLRHAVAERRNHEPHGGGAVAGAQVGAGALGQRGGRLGPDLGRAGAEAPVGGQQVLGDPYRFGRLAHACHYRGRSRQGASSLPPTSRISARVAAVSGSATLAVDAKAKALKAAGEPVIGFGAGEPDFPTPDHIVEAAAAACRDPRMHKYTPAAGLPELREAIAAKTARDSGYEVEAAQVLVTNGGKHAVFNAFLTLLDPGDEVLLPAPYWTTYPEPIRLAGGVPVVLRTDESTGFRVTVDQLDAAVTDRTKALLFVSPSNPTGAVYPRAEVEAIGRWAAERGLWVVTDEIYEHLVYGDHEFHSLPALVPEVADRCIVLNGVAKTYAMTGWR